MKVITKNVKIVDHPCRSLQYPPISGRNLSVTVIFLLKWFPLILKRQIQVEYTNEIEPLHCRLLQICSIITDSQLAPLNAYLLIQELIQYWMNVGTYKFQSTKTKFKARNHPKGFLHGEKCLNFHYDTTAWFTSCLNKYHNQSFQQCNFYKGTHNSTPIDGLKWQGNLPNTVSHLPVQSRTLAFHLSGQQIRFVQRLTHYSSQMQ